MSNKSLLGFSYVVPLKPKKSQGMKDIILDTSQHSIFFYLLLLVMVISVLYSITVGALFFLKSSGELRANRFYGLLLISIGLTLLHNIFVFTGFYEWYPQFSFLPIYYTLAFPTLLFYYVKLTLYPTYQLKLSDAKHFILPTFQFLFFISLFFLPVEQKSQFDRHFFNPFYGGIEQALYLLTFFAYMYFSYRYIKGKKRQLKNRNEIRQWLYLRKLVKVLFVIFCIHAVFVVSDFISYNFLSINLRTVKLYVALGALSFVAVLAWLGVYGFQVLFWGRKVFGKPKT